MAPERMRRRVAGWCVCVYVLVAPVTSSLLSPFHLLAIKFVLRPFPLCSASGKVCIITAEGLRRPHGGIAHAPPRTHPELTSWLLGRESGKIHVYQKPNFRWTIQLLEANFTWVSCIVNIEVGFADPLEGICGVQKASGTPHPSDRPLPAVMIWSISRAWQQWHRILVWKENFQEDIFFF